MESKEEQIKKERDKGWFTIYAQPRIAAELWLHSSVMCIVSFLQHALETLSEFKSALIHIIIVTVVWYVIMQHEAECIVNLAWW